MSLSRAWRTWPLSSLCRQALPASLARPDQLPQSQLVEEEQTPYYHPDRFYPARLGQVLNGRYELATKLGYGSGSTVWLAHDLATWRWQRERFVALKIGMSQHYAKARGVTSELETLKHITQANRRHEGWRFVRKLVDSFAIRSDNRDFECLVFEPLREPLWLYRQRYEGGVIPPAILRVLLLMTLQGLDYLHSECHLIHADLKLANIMVRVEDADILSRDVLDEYHNPLPQKILDDRTIYLSRNNYGPFPRSKPAGIVELVDFDLARSGEKLQSGPIQADVYRAPEVILDAGYSYSADIWSLGALLWDMLENKYLFDVITPQEDDDYDEPGHLAHITALLGPKPPGLFSDGQRYPMFYSSSDTMLEPQRIPKSFTFETSISCMQGREKRDFIAFARRMLKWVPEERSTAKELLQDPWLRGDYDDV